MLTEPSVASEGMILPRQFLRMCRRRMRAVKLADSSGAELSGAALLTRALLLRRLLRRCVLDAQEPHVGVLLPPSVGCVVVNAALALDRRVAVNLNYTASADIINECMRQCGVRHVLTSRRVMERLDLKLDCEIVYLEDLLPKITLGDKLFSAAAAWLAPLGWLERHLGLTAVRSDDLLTIVFTSGSTGRPKGVMLTQRNVGSNVDAVDRIISLREDDVLLGILPIFHSFGYTVTMWTVLALPPKGIYHFSPLEAREVGKLCRRHGATIMISTPTFLRAFLRRCEPEDFAKLDVVFTGAERLPPELAEAFQKRFGVMPVEGYGTTELSPVVSANIPPSRAKTGKGDSPHLPVRPEGYFAQMGTVPFSRSRASSQELAGIKPGTVGRPLPGIRVKVVDLDTGKDLGPNRSGMLLVSGPNVMKGYYGRPDLTAEVIRDGWYVTGDVAILDEEGYITITGRISRFSKLGGEMVPHIRVEEAITETLKLDEDDVRLAVTSVPDAKKGERLVVLHTELSQPPEQICQALAAAGLPPLWIPSPDSFRRVESIPLLGTGKLDLKRLKELAADQFRA